jgi:hypothetical protein
MKITRQIATFCIVSALLGLFTSCIDSEKPLSDEKTSKIDEKLVGNWTLEDGKWTVKKSADVKNALEVLGPDMTTPSVLFTTTIKSKSYLSVADRDPKAKNGPVSGTYQIYQYLFINDDTVEVRGMSSTAIEKAITNKVLQGKISDDDDEPVITDATDKIVKYIEAHADQCFLKPADNDERIIFKRQK